MIASRPPPCEQSKVPGVPPQALEPWQDTWALEGATHDGAAPVSSEAGLDSRLSHYALSHETFGFQSSNIPSGLCRQIHTWRAQSPAASFAWKCWPKRGSG